MSSIDRRRASADHRSRGALGLALVAVSALGAVSLYSGQLLFAVIGGPLIYGLSHLTYLLGMYLAGAEYSVIFMRWWLRTVVEFFLDCSELPGSAEEHR